MQCKPLARLVLAAALTFAFPSLAAAHAYLRASDPAAGATLTGSPKALHFTFTEGIEPAFSMIQLKQGNRVVPTGSPVTGVDASHVTVPLHHALPPGTYTVSWHVTAVDTHRTQGNFTFVIR